MELKSTELDRLRPAWVQVDLTRLARNYQALTRLAGVELMPMIKADAYGHGAVPVARCLERLGARMLGVAWVEEGMALRAAGIGVPIVVLAGFAAQQARHLGPQRLTPVVSTPGMLRAVLDEAAAGTGPPAIHLKVDTGMGRLGLTPDQAVAAARRLQAQPRLAVEGVLTHLAVADEDVAVTREQLDAFDRALSRLAEHGVTPRWVHAANSAGLDHLRPGHNLARPGLLLYGLKPRPLSPRIEVEPVMTVAARIDFVKAVPAGAAVSYGLRWKAARPSRVATLPIGYSDGVPRTEAMSTRGFFGVSGQPAPVAGTVCMDLTLLDVTDLDGAGAAAGAEAVLFGDYPTAWDVAGWAGTNAWQVLTAVGARLPRVYVEDGQVVEVSSRYGAE